jgi:hypothetical protein
MSTDEKMEPRDESAGSDVEAHRFVTEEDDDPDRMKKRTEYEEPADTEGGEFSKKRT